MISSTVPGFYFYSTAGAYLGVASYCS